LSEALQESCPRASKENSDTIHNAISMARLDFEKSCHACGNKNLRCFLCSAVTVMNLNIVSDIGDFTKRCQVVLDEDSFTQLLTSLNEVLERKYEIFREFISLTS
jgi:hypothetical protein